MAHQGVGQPSLQEECCTSLCEAALQVSVCEAWLPLLLTAITSLASPRGPRSSTNMGRAGRWDTWASCYQETGGPVCITAGWAPERVGQRQSPSRLPKTLCQWLLSLWVSPLYTGVIAVHVYCEVLHADVEMMGYQANEGNMNILNNSLNILSKEQPTLSKTRWKDLKKERRKKRLLTSHSSVNWQTLEFWTLRWLHGKNSLQTQPCTLNSLPGYTFLQRYTYLCRLSEISRRWKSKRADIFCVTVTAEHAPYLQKY